MSLIYLTALSAETFGSFGSFGSYAPNWVGITNIFLVFLFIEANAVTSGGHLNRLISFSTMLTGLPPIPRAIAYMLGQTLGGAVARGLIRGTFGKETLINRYHGGGCYYDPNGPNTFSRGRAFLIEMMSSFILM